LTAFDTVIAPDTLSLAATVHLPSRKPAPTVVCCHGLLSSKESPKFRLLGEEWGRQGVAVVRFDFSGCGESGRDFGESLLQCRLRDLEAVLAYVKEQPWANGRLSLMGSSMGGYVSLLAVARRPDELQGAACWATPFDARKIRRFLDERSPLHFPVGYELGRPETLEDLPPLSNVLLVHGQRDEIVPWREASQIHRRLGEPRRLLLLEEAEHRLLSPECRRRAMDASLRWLQRRQ